MTSKVAITLTKVYPAAYIREKLVMAQELVAAGSALVSQNPVGWLRRAIEEDYQPPRNTVRPTQPTGTKSQESKGIPEEQKRAQNIIIPPPVELPQPDSQTEMIWHKIIEHLGEAETRLTEAMLLEVTDTKAMILVPNPALRTWLEHRMYGQIAKAIKGVVGKDLDLQFVAATG
jgi:hypothetical protein